MGCLVLRQLSGPDAFVFVVERGVLGIVHHIKNGEDMRQYPVPLQAEPLDHVQVPLRARRRQRYPGEVSARSRSQSVCEPLSSSSFLGCRRKSGGCGIVIVELLVLDICFSVVFFACQEASIQAHLRHALESCESTHVDRASSK